MGNVFVSWDIHLRAIRYEILIRISIAVTSTEIEKAASLGREKQDAQTFASWGTDYLKYDNCYNEGQEGTGLITYNRYKAMSDALNATGNIPRGLVRSMG